MASQNAYSWPTGEVGADYVQTAEVGGSRFATWAKSAFNPAGMVGVSTVTELASPTVPPTMSQMTSSAYGEAPGGSAAAAVASAAPFSPSESPLPWVIIGLIVGIFGIHRLYYADRRKR